MELLDRETFLEWMERIMKRFDDLKQTAPDIPQRPMIDGEPLLDNQEVCMMLQVSKRTLLERPLYFDPFGQTGFAPVGHNIIAPCKVLVQGSILFYPFRDSGFS